MSLADRVVLVTGGAQGIGRGLAVALASAGAHVVIADLDENAGPKTVADIVEAGGSARFTQLDVTDEESTRKAAAFAVDTFGGVDVLVNNAATYGATTRRPLTDLTVEQWDRTMGFSCGESG